MIAITIYLLDAIRRALAKAGRGLSMLANVFTEAQDVRRSINRSHHHAEE